MRDFNEKTSEQSAADKASGAGGVAAALAMLNSCAEGVSVVNIDNGFGAAVVACRLLRRLKA